MISLLPRTDQLRCLDCVVEWVGAPSLDPCWSCGNTGVNPWSDPSAMIKVRWPSLNSPYSQRFVNDGAGSE